MCAEEPKGVATSDGMCQTQGGISCESGCQTEGPTRQSTAVQTSYHESQAPFPIPPLVMPHTQGMSPALHYAQVARLEANLDLPVEGFERGELLW